MPLVCKDQISPCTGCGSCYKFSESCDVCGKAMREGERYYRLFKTTICAFCIENTRNAPCALCLGNATGGIRYKDFVLCPSCSRIATGYIGYL